MPPMLQVQPLVDPQQVVQGRVFVQSYFSSYNWVMGVDEANNYPPEAFAAQGVLWWKLDTHPGSSRRFGGELKLAAWLAFNKEVGSTFTMRELREAIGEDVANNQEHLNRRLRELRHRDGWAIPSNKDDRTLRVGRYRVDKIGWHPGLGTPRADSRSISQSVRRRVIDRDGGRCTICGVAGGESYPNEPTTRAALTVGHIVPSDRGGSSADMNNLRTECSRCNEPVRQEIRNPESFLEMLPDVRNLRKNELQRLYAWLEAGQRGRDRLDEIFDRARKLSPDDRNRLQVRLISMINGAGG